MKKWHAWLRSFTGLYIVIGIWTPIVWFMSSARAKYQMVTFEISKMELPGVVLFAALMGATLVAQIGFVVLAKERGEYEEWKYRERGES